jgi:hypothetical protein
MKHNRPSVVCHYILWRRFLKPIWWHKKKFGHSSIAFKCQLIDIENLRHEHLLLVLWPNYQMIIILFFAGKIIEIILTDFKLLQSIGIKDYFFDDIQNYDNESSLML